MFFTAGLRCFYSIVGVLAFWASFGPSPIQEMAGVQISSMWLDLLGIPVLYFGLHWGWRGVKYMCGDDVDEQQGQIGVLLAWGALVGIMIGLSMNYLSGSPVNDLSIILGLGAALTAGGSLLQNRTALFMITAGSTLVGATSYITAHTNALVAAMALIPLCLGIAVVRFIALAVLDLVVALLHKHNKVNPSQ
jgi:hypothetical protein